jgi:hypothetical protein
VNTFNTFALCQIQNSYKINNINKKYKAIRDFEVFFCLGQDTVDDVFQRLAVKTVFVPLDWSELN